MSLKVIYHPLYNIINFVTNKSKFPQDGAQVFPYMGWLAIMWPSCGNFDLFVTKLIILYKGW